MKSADDRNMSVHDHGQTSNPGSLLLESPCRVLVIFPAGRMTSKLNSKGQVTIPNRIRDGLKLLRGMAIHFSVNPAGELVLDWPLAPKGSRCPRRDRFDAVRGRADLHWRTDDLMKLLRCDD